MAIANHLSPEIAAIHAELNRRIGDPEVAIGPSYFMEKDIDGPDVLDLVWEHAVIPQLEEHHFGTSVDVSNRYNLNAIRNSATERSVPETEGRPDG